VSGLVDFRLTDRSGCETYAHSDDVVGPAVEEREKCHEEKVGQVRPIAGSETGCRCQLGVVSHQIYGSFTGVAQKGSCRALRDVNLAIGVEGTALNASLLSVDIFNGFNSFRVF
jgi:hypothetical protein